MTNTPKDQEAMLKLVGGKLGISPTELKSQLESGNLQSTLGKMNPDQAKKFNSIIGNQKTMEQFINSPQAQALIKKLSGK